MGASTILFDLDGTLLEMHTESFVRAYLQELGRYVQDRYDPKAMIGHIWEATRQMIASDDPARTNEEVFTEAFLTASGLAKDEVWPVFDAFYRDVFPGLFHLTNPSPWARKIVDAAKGHGFRVAVATNPVFPRQAIHTRLAWIGLAPDEFDWVTVYEECCFTKPHARYYREICDRLGVEPEACVMVGNHMQEDMAAGTLGMKTFLVTDYLEDRGHPVYPVDQRGTLQDLYEAIVNRTGVFAP